MKMGGQKPGLKTGGFWPKWESWNLWNSHSKITILLLQFKPIFVPMIVIDWSVGTNMALNCSK